MSYPFCFHSNVHINVRIIKIETYVVSLPDPFNICYMRAFIWNQFGLYRKGLLLLILDQTQGKWFGYVFKLFEAWPRALLQGFTAIGTQNLNVNPYQKLRLGLWQLQRPFALQFLKNKLQQRALFFFQITSPDQFKTKQ